MTPFHTDPRPIGVFDSGVGGLTVLRALRAVMPGENFLYLGDTARVPYGTKSPETIRAYATGMTAILKAHDVKMIVIACNTASAHATDLVAAQMAPVPVIGMIGPAAAAAARATRNRRILVMGTPSTIRSDCYTAALHAIDSRLTVDSVACQMMVALAEEGWTDGTIARDTVARYIGHYFTAPAAMRPDTVILGCTHFPLLGDVVADVAGAGVALIHNGTAAAESVVATHSPAAITPGLRLMVTDSVERFAPAAARFLGETIDPSAIAHIDLNDFKTYPAPTISKEG